MTATGHPATSMDYVGAYPVDGRFLTGSYVRVYGGVRGGAGARAITIDNITWTVYYGEFSNLGQPMGVVAWDEYAMPIISRSNSKSQTTLKPRPAFACGNMHTPCIVKYADGTYHLTGGDEGQRQATHHIVTSNTDSIGYIVIELS